MTKERRMLVLSRKKNESIVINDDITIVVVEIRGDKVRLGVEAPKEVPVHRREVFDAIRRNKLRIVSRPLKHYEMGSIANRFLRMKLRAAITKRRPRKTPDLENWGNYIGKATPIKIKHKTEIS